MINVLTKESEQIQSILSELKDKMFIIEDEMSSRSHYTEFIETIYNYIKAGFEVKELRECPVYFKFHKTDENMNRMQLRHFLTNIMIWEPFVRINVVNDLGPHHIFDCSRISSKYIEYWLNTFIIKVYGEAISNTKMNKIIHDTLHNLKRISKDFGIILGISMGLKPFIDIAKRNPRFNEIIRTKLDPDMQPAEIESLLDKLLKEELEILKVEESPLKPMLLSGTGIKPKQLAEATISGGLKPDLKGITIPVPINSNLLMGFQNIENYYIDATGGRKAIIMEKHVTGKSGHFARQLMLLSYLKLSKEKDCGSIHPLQVEIKTERHLKRLIGRMYKLYNETAYKILTENDTHLIGQTILVRSPLTCACKKGVCESCYGKALYHKNFGLNVGTYAAARISSPITQMILSAKHLLTSNSVKAEFNENFHRFFYISSNIILLKEELMHSDKYSLVLYRDDINIINELDSGDISSYIMVCYIRDNETGEEVQVFEKDFMNLFISPELYELLGIKDNMNNSYEILFSEIPEEYKIFLIEIENNELTRPLYTIMNLLNSQSYRNKNNICGIKDVNQLMLDLLIQSEINIPQVHAEVLMYRLVRQKENILERPNFRRYNGYDVSQVLTVSSALKYHPSLSVSMSFQYLHEQIMNPLTYRKNKASFMDDYYKVIL
jgi:predicted small secreted protein